MNNTFNIKRFGLLLSKDFQENWKRYILQIIALVGIITIVLLSVSNNAYANSSRWNMPIYPANINRDLLMAVLMLFFSFGIIVASTLMNPMRSKTKRISYLANPASNFEKLFSRWLIVTVGYIIVFFLSVWLADIVRVGFLAAKYPDMVRPMIDLGKLFGNNADLTLMRKEDFCVLISAYFFVQSLFVLGATFWSKASFIKTFAAIIVMGVSFFYIGKWTIDLSYDDFGQFGNVLEFVFNEKSSFLYSCTVVLSLFAIANWIISFFRFKESEIINRL